MDRKLLYFGLWVVVMLLTSCGEQRTLGQMSTGRPYEVLIVADSDQWQTPTTTALIRALHSPIPSLPQRENSFRLMYTTPEHFDHILKLVRCIVRAKINPEYKQSQMRFHNNVYAEPQVVLNIESPDADSFVSYVTQNSSRIVDAFTNFEMNAQIEVLNNNYCEKTSYALDSMFGVRVELPQEMHYLKMGNRFLWASTMATNADQSFVMYAYPLDVKEITPAYFIHKRDSAMRDNIPGWKKNSYMATDTAMMHIKKDKHRTIVRGLWRMEGDLMGGPFVSHIFIDPHRRIVFCEEVFVYSPDKQKGNLIRRLEASLYTMKLTPLSVKNKISKNN